MNVSGNTFFNTISFEDRVGTSASQVPNYKVYKRNYSWFWDIGTNFTPPGDLIIYDIDAQNIYQTVSLTASYTNYFRQSVVFFDEDLTFITTLRRTDDSDNIHYVKVELDPDNSFEATITDLGNATASASNGSTIILDYDKKKEDIYLITIGSSGNFGNSGNGSRFMIYNTISETTTFVGQDWKGASFSIAGGLYRFRNYNIDFNGNQEVFFAARDQEVGGTYSLARYSYRTDSMTYSTDFIKDSSISYNNELRNSLFYLEKEKAVMIPYVQWNNADDIINIRKYSETDFSIIEEVESFPSIFFSYVSIINYNESRDTIETIGDFNFGSNRYLYELGFEQEDNSIPIISGNTYSFIQNYTASIFRNFSASNVQTIGDDNRIVKIYDSARGINAIQPSPRIAGKLIESDPNFNGEPSMDMDGEQNKLDFGFSYRTAVYTGDLDTRNQDKTWYLFIARCPYINKSSRIFDFNDGSSYLRLERQNNRIIFVSGSHNVEWTSSVLSHDFSVTTMYAIKQEDNERGKLWINGGTVIENDNGTDGTASVFESANRTKHDTFFGGVDRAVIISDFIALDTSDLEIIEEYTLVNDLMNPLATKYGLTWSNIS